MEDTELWKPDVCVYHFPCHDGFTAAWAVQRKFPDTHLIGTNYGHDIFERFPLPWFKDRNVIVVDFSWRLDTINLFRDVVRRMVILDHHKSAKRDLESLPGFTVGRSFDGSYNYRTINNLLVDEPIVASFDMERSGARLAWDFFYPWDKVPPIVEYVQDRDLWLYHLNDTRKVSLYLESQPYDFGTWENIAGTLNHAPHSIMAEAGAIERFFDEQVAEIIRGAVHKKISKWNVPVVYAPYSFTSDVGNLLLRKFPDAPFSAVIVDANGVRKYSLRSEDSRQDVSEVARLFGGGGHRNAAGFSVPG